MINLRPALRFGSRGDAAASALLLLSVAVLAGTLAFVLLVPRPDAAKGGAARASGRRRMADDIADARRQARQARAAVRPRLWRGDPQAVAATVLAQLTMQTGHRALKLTAFRPGRSQDFGDVVELRFDAQISGPYAGLHSLLDALDSQNSRVALRSVQITPSAIQSGDSKSGEAAGRAVAATLGLSAFVAADPSALFDPPAKQQTGQKTGGRRG